MSYNTSAEQKMYDLIESASKESLSEGCAILKQALTALNQEFGRSHPGDLPKQDNERHKFRKKAYESIIVVYQKLIDRVIDVDYEALSNEKNRLESELSESEKRGNDLESTLEVVEGGNENLQKEVKELKGTIEELGYEISQLNEAQQEIKEI
jgi:predicted  nucleic acid-binding Zn-ribbon protein